MAKDEMEFSDEDGPGENLVRLNKYLADQGVASRRKCDEMIAAGGVVIDGAVCTVLGTKVDPTTQTIEVQGEVLQPLGVSKRYYLLNKPKGVVCTNEYREARPRAIDLITDPKKGRIYTIGRLDEESQGLILLTNDGEFANLVAHPRHGVPKTYWAKIRGRVDQDAIEQLHSGVHLAEGKTSADEIRVDKRTTDFTTLSLTLREGKNREVRRMFAKLGFKVMQLRRVRIGNLTDRYLKEGDWRPLTRAEVDDLKAIARGTGAIDSIADGRRKPRPGFSKQREPSRPRPRNFGDSAQRRERTGPRGERTGGDRGRSNDRDRSGNRSRGADRSRSSDRPRRDVPGGRRGRNRR